MDRWRLSTGKNDPVRGGVDGPANRPLIDLLKRTAWLKQRYEEAFSGLGWAELGNGLWDWRSQRPHKSFTTRATGIVMAASLPHTITGASPSLDDNDNWFNLGNDVSLRANLGSSDGAKLIGGLNYVTPEMSGYITGVGNADDDTAAIQWALNQNAKQIVLDSTKTYNMQPGVIQHTGKINVNAGEAKIICDGAAVTIINGAGSKWNGGYLISKTTPFTVIYDEDFNVTEYGAVGGRMPYQESPLPSGVDSTAYYQQISCHILFTTTGELQNGISVNNLKSEYGSVVIAGYSYIFIDGCDMIGGALAAPISILERLYTDIN
jgi:hypothetical protein